MIGHERYLTLRAQRLEAERLEAAALVHVRRIIAGPIAPNDSATQDEQNAHTLALDAINAERTAPPIILGDDGWPVMDWPAENRAR